MGRRRADLYVNVENVGRRDEDEVTVEVIVSAINFRDSRTDIELDRDDSTSMTFPIYIPEDARGDLDITIKTFFDNDKQSDEKIVRLGVEACEEEEEEETEVTTPTQQPVQPVPPAAPTGSAVAQPSTRASSPSSGNTGLYVALLIIGIVIVLALLALLIVKLVK
jgi:hypothetical protein